MNGRFALAALLVLALVGALLAAPPPKSGVIGTKHDVGGTGCQSCHAPHNGGAATGGGAQASGQVLLWDRGFSTGTFGTYSSPAMVTEGTVGGEVGSATAPAATEPRMYSFLCMSCHDGVTTTTVISATNPNAIANVANSNGLTNDHPVNMPYDETKNTSLATKANVSSAGLVLYGSTNTLQCASCHEPHNNANGRFLRKANTNSGLCLSCHL